METFTALKDFVDNPDFYVQRKKCLAKLDINTIDAPLVEIIRGFARLPYCFTIQSCYGHFLYSSQKNSYNIEPLPISDSIDGAEYRIAYIALCLDNNELGRALFRDLSEIPKIDPEYIQFGCAEWFWVRQVNSYALQVEPKRYMVKDNITVSYQEALHIQKIRNEFFEELKEMVQIRRKQ